jgi:hypothetical protein
MKTQQLDELWQQYFGSCAPVAHLLRGHFGDRWVRFHSLPESKRYPETEDEMAMVLERHNRVIGKLMGEEQRIILLSTECSEAQSPGRSALAEHALCKGEAPWRSVAMHELGDDWNEPAYWHTFSSDVPWSTGTLDSVLRLAAVDKVANVMLISGQGWLYHPYDGGADVILPTQAARNLLAGEFPSWLSKHPTGL